jgi:hypothetical protein
MRIDVSQVNDLVDRLATVPGRKHALIAMTVKKGAQNIKTAIQDDVQSSKNGGFRHIRIGYEMQDRGTWVEADIHPLDGGASDLANIAFFGTSRGGGTHRFYEHGLDELQPTAQHVREVASTL